MHSHQFAKTYVLNYNQVLILCRYVSSSGDFLTYNIPLLFKLTFSTTIFFESSQLYTFKFHLPMRLYSNLYSY